MDEVNKAGESGPDVNAVLDLVADICRRYEIAALEEFLASCRTFAADRILNIAVLGRFKAGKSSFLNTLIGRPLLPAGVIPVTSVVTEIEYGREERADVMFQDGRTEQTPVGLIREFISESENPRNAKGVSRVRVRIPTMERYRGIRFVDTPGLESVFEHSTGASLEWMPNVGLALVAVGVDPPLSQHDLELIRMLKRYTPRIFVLLTKVDVLEANERSQVEEFVRAQLSRSWDGSVPVFPFSIRPGFEALREALDDGLLVPARQESGDHWAAILRHKQGSLLDECAGYLSVALRSAEISDSERNELRRKILGENDSLADTRLALQLIVHHAMAGSRARFEALLRGQEATIRARLLEGLAAEFPAWTRSLRVALERFEDWLRAEMTEEMAGLSEKHRANFLEPVGDASRRLSQSLQDFRNRLSERTLEALGVVLRTTEVGLTPDAPRTPDVRVGKIFDHNWELISAIVPMTLVQRAVKNNFEEKIADAVFMNLSRLTSQWEEAVNASLLAARKEAERRLDGLVATIGRLIAAAGDEAPRIRADLRRLAALRDESMAGEQAGVEAR